MGKGAFATSSDSGENRMQPGEGSPPPYDGDDILVTGRFFQAPYLYRWVVWGWAEQAYNAGFARRPNYYFSEYDPGLLTPPEADEDKHEVISTITRELSSVEQADYEKFLVEVAATDKLISALPDNAIVKMPAGENITGAQLKALWAKTDLVINEVGHGYQNDTTRGESDFNGGNPQISLNIDWVGNYVRNISAEGRGGLWVIFHELGHLTDYGMSLNAHYADTKTEADRLANERYADDFAKTITEHYTGTHVAINIAGYYSDADGRIEFSIDNPPPQEGYIPFWKFDSFDGSGLEVIL